MEAQKQPQSETRILAQIIWRVARQLASLLEKTYGFGEEEKTAKNQ